MQDMNDLLCFARVVRFGGFAAAERATGERKSKLSKRVARLETHFGARLIGRSNTGRYDGVHWRWIWWWRNVWWRNEI